MFFEIEVSKDSDKIKLYRVEDISSITYDGNCIITLHFRKESQVKTKVMGIHYENKKLAKKAYKKIAKIFI